MALNLALLASVALLGVEVRREWRAAKARQQALLGYRLAPVAAPPMTPLAKPAPPVAATYAAVAEKNLFSKDRNPNVILDPVTPPAQKPVPPFPAARGVMLWDGVPPTVVLSEKAGGPQHGYHPGDVIGEWKIVAVDNQYLSLEWDGKKFKKRLDELLDKTTLNVPEAPAQQATPNQPAQTQVLNSNTAAGPGADVGAGIRACVAGDTSPSGTVVNGMKKMVTATPFGSSCHWESAK